MPDSPTRANALDHIVVVLFENRSLDNLLGHLYGPEDGKTFDAQVDRRHSGGRDPERVAGRPLPAASSRISLLPCLSS